MEGNHLNQRYQSKSAVALPIPLLALVITATLPFNNFP